MLNDDKLERRWFLRQCSVAAFSAGCTITGIVNGKQLDSKTRRKTNDACHADFEATVGDTFSVVGGRSDARLELIEAVRLASPAHDVRPAHVRQEPFSLLFVVRAGKLNESIHRLHNRRMGDIEVFLNPVEVAGCPRGRIYEAVFC